MAAPVVPAAPANLNAAAGNGLVNLSWSTSAGATSYTVKRSLTSGGPYTTLTTATGTSYSDAAVSNGTTYYYVVNAVNSAGTSSNSVQAMATPQGSGPVEPVTGLAVAYRTADTNPNDNKMKPYFNIKNNGTTVVDLSELSIRYWYTIDGDKPQSFSAIMPRSATAR